MFKSITLKRVLGEVGRLENAMKKRSAKWDCGIRRGVLN
jgi:hypothetical protein